MSVFIAFCVVVISCAHSAPPSREALTPTPADLERLGAPCPPQPRSTRTEVRCGHDGRVSLLILTDNERVLGERLPRCAEPYCAEDDPLVTSQTAPAAIEYPKRVLGRLVLEAPCARVADQQTVYVDGDNLWIRTERRAGPSWPVGVLVIADRSRLSASDERLLREGLGLSDTVDLRDDAALGAALDALPAAALARRAPEMCASRGRP